MADVESSIISAAASLIGTLIGGSLAYIYQNRSTKDKYRNDQLELRAALAAEIDSIATGYIGFELAILHDYGQAPIERPPLLFGKEEMQALRHHELKEFQNKFSQMIPALYFLAPAEDRFFGFPVYKAQAGQIGRLKDEAKDIQEFYSSIMLTRHWINIVTQHDDFGSELGKHISMTFSIQYLNLRTAIEQGPDLARRLRSGGSRS